MKKSYDTVSKGSGTKMGDKEPMSEKTGQPYGSKPAVGITPCGIDMRQNEPVMGAEFDPDREVEMNPPCRNDAGIGEGDGQAFPVHDRERYGAI